MPNPNKTVGAWSRKYRNRGIGKCSPEWDELVKFVLAQAAKGINYKTIEEAEAEFKRQ